VEAKLMPVNLDPLRQVVSGDKTVDSKLLNLLGVQVHRTLVSRLIYNLRQVDVDQAVHDRVDELRREGIVLWPNFLQPDHLEGIWRECAPIFEEHAAKLTVFRYGPNTYEAANVRKFDASALPYTHKFFAEPRLHAILQAAEKRPLHCLSGNRVLERLTQGPVNGQEDGETELHSDIFFTNHKAWLYLNDVEMDHGPFVYVKRSHRVSLTKLYYIYKESCTRNQGSRRIAPEELERLGLQETIVTCPKNTLVLANVAGFHRRLRGRPGFQRHAVHVSLRVNPFAWWRYRSAGLH
jgi:hypothetical protein